MLRKDQLDKMIDHKNQVIVRILFPDIKAYNANAEALKKIADDAGASGAVRMG